MTEQERRERWLKAQEFPFPMDPAKATHGGGHVRMELHRDALWFDPDSPSRVEWCHAQMTPEQARTLATDLIAAARVIEAEAQGDSESTGCFRCGHDPMDDHSPGGCHIPGCGCSSPFGGLT